MKNKKIIIFLLIIITGIILIISEKVSFQEKEKLIKTQNKIKVTEEKYQLVDDMIYYDSIIVNESDKLLYLKKMDVIFYDENGDEIVVIINEINKEIEEKDSISISSETKVNQTKKIGKVVYKFHY